MKTINVLSIGNSFSQDAQRYLHELAKSEGVNIQSVNLMIGGCSLELHFRNMYGDKHSYTIEANGHNVTGFNTSIEEALLARNWDYVTLQQVSLFSYDYYTYMPYMECIAQCVRELCPKAKLLIHETWGYESCSERIRANGFETFDEMFARIKENYARAAKEIDADGILPSGSALLNALNAGVDKIHRDTFHASLGLGRFILALVWYKYMTGNSIDNVSFNNFDEPVSEEEYKIAIDSVNKVFNQ